MRWALPPGACTPATHPTRPAWRGPSLLRAAEAASKLNIAMIGVGGRATIATAIAIARATSVRTARNRIMAIIQGPAARLAANATAACSPIAVLYPPSARESAPTVPALRDPAVVAEQVDFGTVILCFTTRRFGSAASKIKPIATSQLLPQDCAGPYCKRGGKGAAFFAGSWIRDIAKCIVAARADR